MQSTNTDATLFALFILFLSVKVDACTLKIPAQNRIEISSVDLCHFSPIKKNNYFDLSYYKAATKGFDKLVAEGVDIEKSNEGLHLPMEFIQDANYSIAQLSPRTMKNTSSYPVRLESTSLIYVMSMPKKQFKGAQTFSLKLKCLEAAGGDNETSFTTRYCIPLSKKTDRELTAYRNFVARVKIQQDR